MLSKIIFPVIPLNLSVCASAIRDPRQPINQKHSLESLVLIVFSSIISGYDSPSSMSEFAAMKLDWLKKFTDIKSAPCPETLRFFLACIKSSDLIKGFSLFVSSLNECAEQDIISLDGKTMRGTKHNGREAVHVISAWSQRYGITLCALESEGKKNEIKTLPKLIDKLDAKGATLTIDAMGCQKAIAEKVIEKKADYFLQLKNNQQSLLDEIKAYHHKLERDGYEKGQLSYFEEVDKGHGRLEVRKYQHFELSDWVEGIDEWKGLTSAVRVERYCQTKKGESTEVAWYISSLKPDAKHASQAIRGHWEVENKLHWRLDVIFKEDACQAHSAALNIAVIKRHSMNLLKINDQSKKRMKHRVMSCAICDGYREAILFAG